MKKKSVLVAFVLGTMLGHVLSPSTVSAIVPQSEAVNNIAVSVKEMSVTLSKIESHLRNR